MKSDAVKYEGDGRIKVIVAVEVFFNLSEEGRESLADDLGIIRDRPATFAGFTEGDIVFELDNELQDVETEYGTFEIGAISISDKYDLS